MISFIFISYICGYFFYEECYDDKQQTSQIQVSLLIDICLILFEYFWKVKENSYLTIDSKQVYNYKITNYLK
jgi:hypothetical protein